MKTATKISTAFLITAFIISAAGVHIFYTAGKNGLVEAVHSKLRERVRGQKRHVETFLEMQKLPVVLVARDRTVEDFLVARPIGANDAPSSDYIDSHIAEAVKTGEGIKEIFLLDAEGTIVASSAAEKIGLDRSDRDYFLAAQAGPYVKSPYLADDTGEREFVVSAPVHQREDHKFLGAAAARISVKALDRLVVEHTGLGESEETYLVNKFGYMLTPSRFVSDSFLKIIGGAALEPGADDYGAGAGGQKDKTGTVKSYFSYRGVRVLGADERISGTDWTVVGEIDETEVLAPIIRLKSIALLILIGAPLAAWAIGIWVARWITRPICRLQEGIEVIGKGNYDYRIESRATDEIGRLSRAFDRMTSYIKAGTTSIDLLNKEIVERKTAEKTIRDQRAFLEHVLDSFTQPFYVIDIRDYTVKVANAAARTSGVADAKMCYALVRGRKKPCGGENVCPAAWVRKHRKPIKLERTFVGKDGHTRYAEVHGYPIFDKEGNVIQMIEYSMDITARKEAEKILAKNLEDLREFREVTVERENAMIELKKQINELSIALGRPPLHDLAFLEEDFS